MTPFQQALAVYLTERGNLPTVSPNGTLYDYVDLDVRHEEGWSNDSGTTWPSSVYLTYTRVHMRNGKKVGSRRDEMYVGSDPVDFMRALFEVVEDTGTDQAATGSALADPTE